MVAEYGNLELDQNASGDPVIRDVRNDTIVVDAATLEATALTLSGALIADSADVANNLEAGSADILGALTADSATVTNALTAATTDTDALAFDDANEPIVEQTAQTGTVTLDLSQANRFRVEADGNITIAFSNVSSTPPGNSVIVYLYDTDATGPHTVSWPTGTEWPGGSITDTIASGSDVEVALTSDDGGTTWRASERGAGFQ